MTRDSMTVVMLAELREGEGGARGKWEYGIPFSHHPVQRALTPSMYNFIASKTRTAMFAAYELTVWFA